MSVYRDALLAAQRKGRESRDAMEKWVSRPADAPDDTPAALLERYAENLRSSREQLRELYAEHGNRDDIMHALDENEAFHRGLGLSVRDKPDIEAD